MVAVPQSESRPRLIDRADELTALAAHRASLIDGDPHDLLLVGPAGVGKTVLVQAAISQARSAGVSVLQGSGERAERGLPWGVAIQVLTPLVRAGAHRIARPAEPVARLVAGEPIPEAAPPAYHLLHAVHWLLSDAAEVGPLLLVVDDLHWADHQSAAMLRFLQRRAEGARLSLLVAAREGEVEDPRVRQAITALAADPRGTSIALRPLSPAGAHALAAEVAGPGREDLVQRVAHVSGGNPLLCRTLAAAAIDAEVVTIDAAEIVEGLPSLALQALLQRRLHGLGEAATAVGEALAVLGPRARMDALTAVVDRPLEEVAGAVGRLVAAGLVVLDGDRPSFSHPVDEIAVLQGVSPAQRVLLHRRAAVALHAAAQPPQVVAGHLVRGSCHDLPWARPMLAAAAAQHEAVGDLAGAVPLLEAALAVPCGAGRTAPGEGQADLLRRLAAALLATASPAAASTIQRARAAADVLPAAATTALGDVLYGAGRFAEAVDAYADALRRVDGDPAEDVEVAALLARDLAATRMAGVDSDPVRRRIDRVADAAGPTPSVPERIMLAAAAGARALAGERSAARVTEMVARADIHGLLDHGLGPVVVQPGFGALWSTDDIDGALAVLHRSGAGRADVGQLGVVAMSTLLLRHRGRLSEAEAQAQWLMDVADEVDLPPGLEAPARVTLALSALDDDDLQAASLAIGPVPTEEALHGNPFGGALLMAAGRLAHRRGDLSRAVALHEAAGRVLVAAGGTGTVFAWRSALGLAQVASGQREAGMAAVEEELRRADAFGVASHIAAALRARARLRPARAEDDLRRAVSAVAGGQARLEHARCLIGLGAAIRRAGRRRDARSVLREGLDVARSIGARGLADRAVAELAASGATRPELPVTGVQALTPTESRVAHLAADGLSNRQIAEHLVVTRKTVEFHLSGVYRKLAIDGRDGLADALR